jgi:hypothetical protein
MAASPPDQIATTSSVDYVIIGAGSAGWDREPWIYISMALDRNILRRTHDWMLMSEASPTMGGRRMPMYRGRVIGGPGCAGKLF